MKVEVGCELGSRSDGAEVVVVAVGPSVDVPPPVSVDAVEDFISKS